MAIQRCRVELRENIDLGYCTVYTIAHRDINQTIIRSKWNGWLCSLFGQRIQARPSSTSKNNTQNTLQQIELTIKLSFEEASRNQNKLPPCFTMQWYFIPINLNSWMQSRHALPMNDNENQIHCRFGSPDSMVITLSNG